MSDEKIVEVEIERLITFKNHPFKVGDDKEMSLLKDSIEKYGILNPIIVRPTSDGVYEIISGHRRKHAAEMLGHRKVPVIIRVLDDNESVIQMVDSNMQRENISYSEKAFAILMKSEAIKKIRTNKNSQIVHEIKGKRTIEIISEESGESPKQIQRYISITKLIPKLLEKLDMGELSFTPAVSISALTKEEQKAFLEAMEYTQSSPSLSQAQRIKKLSGEGNLSLKKMKEILSEEKNLMLAKVSFTDEQLYKYFPKNYTPEMMKREILELLKTYTEEYWND